MEPAEYTFSVTTATGAVGSILAYSGVDAVQPVDASGGRIARNARWIVAPSVTTSSPQALLVGAFAQQAVGVSSVPVVIFTPSDPDVGLLTEGNEVALASDPRCLQEPSPVP